MGVVELDGHLLGQGLPGIAAPLEPAKDVGQRAGDEEVLLEEPERSAPRRRVVGVEHPRERLGHDLVEHRAEELASGELAEIEEVGRGRGPEPQGVDRPAAVAGDGTIVGHAQQVDRLSGNLADRPALEPERAVQRDLHGLGRPRHLPGVGMEQPVVRLLDLEPVAELLPEHPVLVPQAVADRRDLQGRQRVEKARGQPPQAAVAQAGVGLGLEELVPVLMRIGPQILVHERPDAEIRDRVEQRPADQELHRQVVDLLGVRRSWVDCVSSQRWVKQIAKRTGHRLESLPLVGLLHRDHVVEDQVAIVVVPIGEPELGLVRLQTLLGRQAGHVLSPALEILRAERSTTT